MQCPILQEWPYIKETADTVYGEDACVEHAIEDFAKVDLEIMITELCVRTNGGNTKSEMETQAKRYKEMYQLLWDMDKENGGQAQITSVTTFGISDSYRLYPESNWKPGDESRYGWLFDKNCKAKLAFKSVYNVFANAKGKPTVEEVYEKPEGQGDEVDTHIISGKVTMKNGQPLKNTYISFDNWDNEYEGITDEEGNYVISVPNGEYDIYIAYYGYLEDVVVVSADMEEDVTLDIPLGTNFYQISGKVVAKNGEIFANTEIAFMVTDDTGDLRSFWIGTDENGEFEERMLEGTYTGRDSFVEGISFTIDAKTDVSKPLVITLTKDVYQVKGEVTLGDMTTGKNEHSFFTLYFKNIESGTSEYANLDDDKTYSIILSEGNYDVTGTNWIISDAGEELEDYFYFGQIEVKEKMTWDLSMELVHEVTVETSSLEGVADVDSLRVNEVYLSPYGKGNAYIGNETGTIEGMFYDRDEEGNKTAWK